MQLFSLATGSFSAAFLSLALAIGGGTDPLDVTCPPSIVKLTCGMPYGPDVAGEPDVQGGCAPYTVTYSDFATTPNACPARRFVQTVKRTWTITDSCGNSATCVQEIHILKELIALDLHPTSCPNPLNRRASGVYPAAINGTPDFDVTTIIPGSLQLWGFDCRGGPLAPIPSFTTIADVSSPYFAGGNTCSCSTAGPDGYPDLIFKFDTQAMVTAFGMASLPRNTNLQLVIVGDLIDGCRFIGVDCVRVQ